MDERWIDDINATLRCRGYVSKGSAYGSLHFTKVYSDGTVCECSLSPCGDMIPTCIEVGITVVDTSVIPDANERMSVACGLPMVRLDGGYVEVAYPDEDWTRATSVSYVDVRLYALLALVKGAKVTNPPVEYTETDKARALAWWSHRAVELARYRAEDEARKAAARTEDEEAAADYAQRHATPIEFRGTPFEVPDFHTVRGWTVDETCEALDGCTVEPDGVCSHGYPSWLIQLGLMGHPLIDGPTGNQAHGY